MKASPTDFDTREERDNFIVDIEMASKFKPTHKIPKQPCKLKIKRCTSQFLPAYVGGIKKQDSQLIPNENQRLQDEFIRHKIFLSNPQQLRTHQSRVHTE